MNSDIETYYAISFLLVNKILMDLNRIAFRLTAEPDDPSLKQRKKSPCREEEKFEKLLLPSSVLPA